jgi:hypothetical protein
LPRGWARAALTAQDQPATAKASDARVAIGRMGMLGYRAAGRDVASKSAELWRTDELWQIRAASVIPLTPAPRTRLWERYRALAGDLRRLLHVLPWY